MGRIGSSQHKTERTFCAAFAVFAFAVALLFGALPATAQSAQKILFAQKGPIVSGISYCYAVMSGRENIDRAAKKRGLVTPTDKFGKVFALDKPRPKRRAWTRIYTGPNAGKSGPPTSTDIAVSVRYRETKCEVAVFGVPKSFGKQVVPVTKQVFAKLNRDLTLQLPFRKVLVAGKGPSWHGGLYFESKTYSGGVSFDIGRSGLAVWGVDLVRRDILKRKYGG